jgi:hypothetical protein
MKMKEGKFEKWHKMQKLSLRTNNLARTII